MTIPPLRDNNKPMLVYTLHGHIIAIWYDDEYIHKYQTTAGKQEWEFIDIYFNQLKNV